MNQNTNLKKRLILLVFIAGIVGIFFGLRSYYKGAPVTISSDAEAEIYFSNTQDGTFKSVGKGRVSRRIKQVPSTLYVKVVSNKGTSLSGLFITNDKAQELSIPIDSKQQATLLYEGGLRDSLITGNAVAGIEPKSSMLVNFGIGADIPPRVAFIGVPYLKEITWIDSNNFVYSSFKNGVGIFKDGKRQNSLRVGSVILNKNGAPQQSTGNTGEGSEISQQVVDIAKGGGNNVFFLAKKALYISRDLGATLTLLDSFEDSADESSIAATDNSVFRFVPQEPAEYADEAGKPVKPKESQQTALSEITQYNYAGEKLAEFNADGTKLLGAGVKNDINYMLTNKELMKVQNNTGSRIPLYPAVTAGLVAYENEVYVLVGAALWRLSPDGKSLLQIAELKDGTVALVGSLSVQNNQIVFASTSFGAEGTSQTFAITPSK